MWGVTQKRKKERDESEIILLSRNHKHVRVLIICPNNCKVENDEYT